MSDDRELRMQQKLDNVRNEMASKIKQFDRPVFGYVPPVIERKEGDEWTDDDGKLWTIKGGLKQSISKLQSLKKPWWCPKCNIAMSHKFDDKFWSIYNMCHNCVLEKHTKMVLDGTWEAFEKKMLRENEKAWLKDHIAECKDYIRTFKVPQIHFENGGWEQIAKLSDFTELFSRIKNDIKFAEDRIAQIEKEELEELNVPVDVPTE